MRFYRAQQGFGVNLENRKLVVKRSIENDIRFVLERENMFPFSPLNAFPHVYGPRSSLAAELRVADDTPDQAVVRGRNAVVVIEIELGKCGKIDLVFQFRRDKRRHLVVEGMNAFKDENGPVLEFERTAGVFALPRLEIKRKLYFGAFEK